MHKFLVLPVIDLSPEAFPLQMCIKGWKFYKKIEMKYSWSISDQVLLGHFLQRVVKIKFLIINN